MRVGIIGAGIGGTCLAHGLRRTGVDVVVFERNPKASSGLPGYGIHINVFGRQAMEECLPSESWEAFLKAARPIGGPTRFYDEDLELLAAQRGEHRKDGHTVGERRLSISRSELIDILSGELDDVIRRETEFRHFEPLDGEGVRVTFADGARECVDVLVGADGANSRVRKQYLPNVERFDVGVSVIVGRSRLTPELAAEVPADLVDGSPNSIVPRSTDWMFVSVWRAPVDTNAAVADSKIDTYVVWAYIAATSTYRENLAQMSPVALCDLVQSRTTNWHPSIHRLIKQSDLLLAAARKPWKTDGQETVLSCERCRISGIGR